VLNLSNLLNVTVKRLPQNKLAFPEMLEPKGYAYKWPMVSDATEYSDYVLWIDAGVMFWKNPGIVFEILHKEEVFLVQDAHLNRNWTSEEARKIMEASEEELNGKQLSAGITGFKSNGKYQSMLNDCVKYANIKDCVFGKSAYSDSEVKSTGIFGHRHDQSISSILAVRYHCPTQSIGRFGEYNQLNLDENNAVIFVHRGSYEDHTSLIFRS